MHDYDDNELRRWFDDNENQLTDLEFTTGLLFQWTYWLEGWLHRWEAFLSQVYDASFRS